ncbi:Hypothetical Protein FCC1311_052812 [Hondaea fermentalgiana]|uniref:CinA C-terminal domain-containing protein n=1 Tax=Hondaea fermentalgiana TaxID=2315210 RepID=A0A2R5GFF4_9STRA|nr:Hypothetical Protein FCC1311_052812 [Hondaea fermentalgiana]|eukprot:GBG29059.1 Hypothetical Protein FCC1311_052812 [Hondaea fermentalgiana]
MDAERAARAARLLAKYKQRVAVVEATQFFISSCVVYSGRGYKNFLPPKALEAASVFDRENNYKNKANYVESKKLFAESVAPIMREHYRADWCVVESGTSGPTFYIPGVETGFTAVGVAGPPHPRTGKPVLAVRVIETSSTDRVTNMAAFTTTALDLLADTLEDFHASTL